VTRRSLLSALVIDLAIVVVFVVIGRRQHDEGSAAAGIVRTALPFLIALVVAWAVAKPFWPHPTGARTGLAIWLVTLVVGMLLRRFAFDRGTATAFVIVATVFLGTTLNGWRAISRTLAVRRTI
jgi:MFS-type transporter involved in bile tolerance (Atg22 family)